MATAIESDQLKAERLLIELCPDNSEFKKLMGKGRSQERIRMIRQAIESLLCNGIPTATIGNILKLGQGAIQYHARWLEKNGRIIRPSKTSHWIWARENGEN